MKNVLLIFLSLLTLISPAQVKESSYNFGLKAGGVLTDVTGAPLNGMLKKGFIGGAWFRLKLEKKWSAQLEVSVLQKGTYFKKYYYDYNLNLVYGEVPVLLQFHHKRWTLEAGPGFGYLIKQKEHFYNFGSDMLKQEPVKQTELSFNLGFSYRISNSAGINIRYSNSIWPVRRDVDPRPSKYVSGQYNNVIAIALTYTYLHRKKKPNK